MGYKLGDSCLFASTEYLHWQAMKLSLISLALLASFASATPVKRGEQLYSLTITLRYECVVPYSQTLQAMP
jgi:hypothetical protein